MRRKQVNGRITGYETSQADNFNPNSPLHLLVYQVICLSVSLFLCFTCLHAQTEEKDLQRTDSLIKKEEFGKALPLLTAMLGKYGEKEKIYTQRAFCYLQLDQPDNCIADYKKAIAINPSCVKCYVNMGILETKRKNYTDALTYLNKGIELEPYKPMALVKRGELLYEKGEYNAALSDFNKALNLDPNEPYIYVWLGMTEMALNKNNEALAHVNNAIKLQPNVEFAYYLRGKCYLQLRQYQAAATDLAACIDKRKDNYEYYAYYGIALYNLKLMRQALEAFSHSITLNQSDYMAFQYRSLTLFELGYFDEACKDKQRARDILVKAYPSSYEAESLRREAVEFCDPSVEVFYINRGYALYRGGEFLKGVTVFNEGLKKFPLSPRLWHGQGNGLMSAGKFKDAIAAFEKGIASNRVSEEGELSKATEDAIAWNSIAFGYVNLNDLENAIRAGDSAILLYHNNPLIEAQSYKLAQQLSDQGMLFGTLSQYDKALSNFEKALQADPSSVSFNNRRH
jgi:tetratricopeptide (TPR) repeat protein